MTLLMGFGKRFIYTRSKGLDMVIKVGWLNGKGFSKGKGDVWSCGSVTSHITVAKNLMTCQESL